MSLRSWLFVPGDSEKKLSRGADTGADVLILDLEDSVADARKPVGREMTCEYLQHSARDRQQLWVRINPLDTPHALRDLAGIIQGKPDGLILPKAESVEDSYKLGHYLDALEVEHGIEQGNTKILALVTETPGALLTLEGYRRPDPRVSAISWGAEDLSAALGASSNRDDQGVLTDPYTLARSLCLLTPPTLQECNLSIRYYLTFATTTVCDKSVMMHDVTAIRAKSRFTLTRYR